MVRLPHPAYKTWIFHIWRRSLAQQHLMHTSHHSELQTFCNPLSQQLRRILQQHLFYSSKVHPGQNLFLQASGLHVQRCLYSIHWICSLKNKEKINFSVKWGAISQSPFGLSISSRNDSSAEMQKLLRLFKLNCVQPEHQFCLKFHETSPITEIKIKKWINRTQHY